MLDRISFNHFFMETKDKITPELYRKLNPEIMSFFKSGDSYLALTNQGQDLTIAMLIGSGLDWIHDLRRECIKYNVLTVNFYTSINNKIVQRIAKYAKAEEIEKISNFYGDGIDGILYQIDLTDTKRFR